MDSQRKSIKDIEVWIVSIEMAKNIYQVTSSNAWNKDYGFKDQIRRASISISSNIAEGFERNNNKIY